MTSEFGFTQGASRQQLIEQIDEWLCGEAMKHLVRLFSGGWHPNFVPEPVFYDSLVRFVDERWNSRGVVTTERYATNYGEVPIHLQSEVIGAARDMGLMNSLPPSASNYDAILAPGTQLWSMIMRIGHMRELQLHKVTADRYVGLGSHRPLTEEEVADADTFGLDGSDEYSLMCSIFGAVFGDAITGNVRTDRVSGSTTFVDSRTDFRTRAGLPEFFALSTSNANGKRPTTFDTLRGWAAETRTFPEIRRVLFVTQPLYVYQQGAVAIEVLGLENGLDVEVVGAQEREYLPGFRFPDWSAARILQEVNGSVKRLVSLRARLIASSGS